MMKLLKNQVGYALVIVLLTITVIMILIPPILSNLLNSTQQYQTTEQRLQLTKLEDMGVIYFKKALNNATEEARTNVLVWLEDQSNAASDNVAIINQYKEELQSSLGNYGLGSELEIIVEPNEERFKIMIDSITIEDNTNLSVKSSIIPSLDNKYDESNVIDQEQTINLQIQ